MKDFINETAERLEFPYTCSICLRYFNSIFLFILLFHSKY